MNHATPAREDKRYHQSSAVLLAICALTYAGKVPPEAALNAIVAIAGMFLVQSQVGQTLRTIKPPAPPPKDG